MPTTAGNGDAHILQPAEASLVEEASGIETRTVELGHQQRPVEDGVVLDCQRTLPNGRGLLAAQDGVQQR